MFLVQRRIFQTIVAALSMCLLTVLGSQGIKGKYTATILDLSRSLYYRTLFLFMLYP